MSRLSPARRSDRAYLENAPETGQIERLNLLRCHRTEAG
jgi:hypothetical protein